MSLPSSMIASFALSSIDPPGERRRLMKPYNQPPLKRSPLTEEAVERVCSMAPLPRLHRSFIPDMNVTWKPPVMYYGWSIGDLQPKLLQYAEEHDLLSHTVMEGISKAVTPSGANTSDSDDSDDEGELGSVHWGDTDDEEDEMEGEVCVDVANSAQNALWAIVEEAGVRVRHFQPYTRPFRLRGVLHEPHHVAISIYSNYELDQAVSDDDIAKVQKLLDIKEVPAWYVSNMASEWSPFPPRL